VHRLHEQCNRSHRSDDYFVAYRGVLGWIIAVPVLISRVRARARSTLALFCVDIDELYD
jgi:hypothetical protein